MLEVVGFPVAVNPEPRLASIARKRGWLVEDFRPPQGFRHRLLPLARKWLGTPGRPGVARVDPDGADPMKALVIDRDLNGSAPRRVAERPATGRRRPLRTPLSSTRSTLPRCPGPDWVRIRAPPVGHLRVRPRHRRRHARQPLVRADRLVPLRAGPRGRGRRRRNAGGRRAGARLRRPGHLTAVHRVRRGPARQLRAPGPRPPRRRAADRVLLRHRRWLVGGDAWPTPASCTRCPTSSTTAPRS